LIDLFQPGAYCRTAGGNLEQPAIQAPVVRWMSWSINPDNGGAGDPGVWDRCRSLWTGAGIQDFPWLHCRSWQQVTRLISIAKQYNSPAIGLNIEDVVGDGLNLQQLGALVQSEWGKPVHMAVLPWVQNGAGWEHMSFAVAALEINPDENDPSKHIADCLFHAKAEGLTKVTLMLKTAGFTPAYYGDFWKVCHSLYTADDITPDQASWASWIQAQPCIGGEPVPPDPWYAKPYKKGTAVGPPKLPRVLEPPDGTVMAGDDVTAIKRAISHAQRWLPWAPSQWDNRYNKYFAFGKGTGQVGDSGVRGFQRQEGITQNGVLNDDTYQKIRRALIPTGPREGEHILDAISIALIKSAQDELGPEGQREKVRAAIADFCERAESSEELWHYTQQRPYSGLGLAPERYHENDCSSYVAVAYFWARQQTKLLVPDPTKYRYTGYGNTWDDLDGHPRVTSGNYLIGDLAHYDGHVTLCRKPGNATRAIFSSFGQESGPEPTNVHYRGDFIKVVRPRLLP
jgi:hypothetical protein